MADLIEKYFKEDLTAAERQALRQELLSSDTASERFGERAEEAYLALGLPAPQWSGPDRFRPTSSYHLWKWLGFGMLFIGIAGAMGWVMWKANNAPQAILSAPSLEMTPVSLRHLKPRPKTKIPLSGETLRVTRVEPLRLQPGLAPATIMVSKPVTVSTAPTPPAMAQVNPKFTPVNVDQSPDTSFSSLSVVLRRPTSGFLTVRVLDASGAEVMPLYGGNLPAGSWGFTWDGLLRNGLLAPPGKYRIEVRAGSWVQVKEVLVQK
jgi:hypothetical protein